MATSGQRATAASSGAVRLDGLRPRRLRWLWRKHIPAGMISALAGRPGEGKSLLALHVAADVSRAGGVLVSSSEDPLAEQVVPRALAAAAAAGGDRGRIYFERLPALPAALGHWARRIGELDLRLIVADPLASHLTPRLGADQAVRRALDPLAALCAASGCAVLALAHTIKRPPPGAEPLAAVGGAGGGLAGQARAVYLFGQPPGGDERLLAQAKCNLAASRPSLRFQLDVRNLGAGIAAPLLRYTGRCELDAHTLLNPAEQRQPTSQTEAAAAWLVDYLFAAGPPYQRPQREIEEDAKQLGITTATLRRAAHSIPIASRNSGPNPSWELPAHIAAHKQRQHDR